MSTADSQILVCSGAVTQDIFPRWKESYLATKLATLAVTGLALCIALFAHQGVFALVLVAWSAMGAGLGPALILRLLGARLTAPVAVTMMAVGVGTVVAWQIAGLDGHVFKLLPGLIASFSVWVVVEGWRRMFSPGDRSDDANARLATSEE
jgi:sodium/proline symporter